MPSPSFAIEAPECTTEANNRVCPQSRLHFAKKPKYPEEREELLAGLKMFSYITGNHLPNNMNAYETQRITNFTFGSISGYIMYTMYIRHFRRSIE